MDATDQSIGFTYNPDRWEEAIFAERFLYPYCTPEEAGMFRAMGRYIFYRALEYNTTPDRGEPRIIADLRGATRDLHLVHRFVHNVGCGFDVCEVRPEERQYVLHAAAIASRLLEVTKDLGRMLPTPRREPPREEPMTSKRRRALMVIRRDWEAGLRNRQQRKADAEAQIEQALAEIRGIDELLAQPDEPEEAQ